MKKIFSAFALALLLGLPLVQAQTKVPFELLENKIILFKTPIDGKKDSLKFLFDTGATITTLERKVAQKLGIKPNQTDEVAGASGTRKLDVATGQRLKLAENLWIENADILLDDLQRLNESSGYHYDGVIGYDVLDHYLTEIDIDNKHFIFYPKNSKKEFENYEILNFDLPDEIPIPHIPVEVTLRNSTKVKGAVLYDSGASLNMLFNSRFVEENDILPKFEKTVNSIQEDFSGRAENKVGLIKGLKVGPYDIHRTMLAYISTEKKGVTAMPGYLGLLGEGVIYRFNSVLDYENKKLYLKPAKIYEEPFHSTLSPAKLALQKGKITAVAVVEGSEAYKAGLREGDKILKIDGKQVSFPKANQLLTQEGKTIKIEIENSKKEVKILSFKLNSLL